MINSEVSLPNTLDLAHQKILDQEQKLQAKDLVIQNCYQAIADLNQQLKLAKARQFGRSAESFVDPNAPTQDHLFDEAEILELMGELTGLVQTATDAEAAASDDETKVQVPAHERTINRGKRQPLPAYLARVETVYELSPEELIGPNGERFEPIGFETSEQLNIIPQEIYVLLHKRMKYAVKGLEELGVRTARMPLQIIPKSIASAGLLAHTAQAKYQHHLPLYRQEQIWKELDVDLSRATTSRWMIDVGTQLQPLIDLLFKSMKATGYLHADETTLTILKNKKSGAESFKGYMWVYVNDQGSIYDFRTSRAGAHPAEMLHDFKGHLQVDGYSGYNIPCKNPEIIPVGCFAHVRRKFTDIQKAEGKKIKMPVVEQVLKQIQALYKIESDAKEHHLNPEAVHQVRQKYSKPILDNLHEYLLNIKLKTTPRGLLGKAVNYALNQWPYVIRYIDAGHLDIDNNAAERCVKPFAVGRKNWLFSGTTDSAKASGNIFSLIESAKIHDLKVFDYLKYVFEKLPMADTEEKLAELLPMKAKEHLPKIKQAGNTNPIQKDPA